MLREPITPGAVRNPFVCHRLCRCADGLGRRRPPRSRTCRETPGVMSYWHGQWHAIWLQTARCLDHAAQQWWRLEVINEGSTGAHGMRQRRLIDSMTSHQTSSEAQIRGAIEARGASARAVGRGRHRIATQDSLKGLDIQAMHDEGLGRGQDGRRCRQGRVAARGIRPARNPVVGLGLRRGWRGQRSSIPMRYLGPARLRCAAAGLLAATVAALAVLIVLRVGIGRDLAGLHRGHRKPAGREGERQRHEENPRDGGQSGGSSWRAHAGSFRHVGWRDRDGRIARPRRSSPYDRSTRADRQCP